VTSDLKLTERDITLSHFSLRYATLEERITAATAAGFAGIGIYGGRYEKWLAGGWTPSGIASLISDHGLTVTELEAVQHWAGNPEERAEARRQEDVIYRMADDVGGTTMSVVGNVEGSAGDAAETFAAICDRAKDHGLAVGIEFAATTGLPNIASAVEVLDLADRANGGLCIDTWHFFRGDPAWIDLEALAGDRVVTVQMNDGTTVPEDDDYFADNMVNRRTPGAGEFDLVRFIQTLDKIGSTAPIAIEVISARLQGLASEQAAVELATGARSVLTAARSGN
jgi:sugar phosphate isomerase/epimerase